MNTNKILMKMIAKSALISLFSIIVITILFYRNDITILSRVIIFFATFWFLLFLELILFVYDLLKEEGEDEKK